MRPRDVRPPAQPRTAGQHERADRILRAAAALGAEHGLEDVQMGDVAARADVALATLYRYFPSKHHLFAGLLTSRVGRLPATPAVDVSPAEAVAGMLTRAVRGMLTDLPLARAMIVSMNVLRAEDSALTATPFAFDQLILDTAGLARTSAEDRRLARLLEQTTYGVLTWATAGEISPEQAVDDVRRACELLLAPWSGRARTGR